MDKEKTDTLGWKKVLEPAFTKRPSPGDLMLRLDGFMGCEAGQKAWAH